MAIIPTYSSSYTQWAAVKTCLDVINVPPKYVFKLKWNLFLMTKNAFFSFVKNEIAQIEFVRDSALSFKTAKRFEDRFL